MAGEVRFKKEHLDELLAGQDAKTVFEQDGWLDDLKKARAERILNAEMEVHLGQEAEQTAGNHRNGASSKTVLTDTGRLPARGRCSVVWWRGEANFADCRGYDCSIVAREVTAAAHRLAHFAVQAFVM